MYSYKDEKGERVWTFCKLKFYYDDFRIYKKEYAMELTNAEARQIFNKLCRHFKLTIWLGVKKGRGGLYRKSWSGGGEIFLPNCRADLGILCHEISHAIHHQKYHKQGHNKQLKKIMDRVIRYCRKKNYWKESSVFDFLETDWDTTTHAVESVGVPI